MTSISRPIQYRAVHTNKVWRRATHSTIDAAKSLADGAGALFAGRARIDYEANGEALFVVIWNPQTTDDAWVLKKNVALSTFFEERRIPVDVAIQFDLRNGATLAELEGLFT